MKVKAKNLVHDRLFDDSEHRGLSAGNEYDVVGLDGANFRVIDDNDQPFLYPKALFDVVDPAIPNDWIVETVGDESFIDPPECAGRGFYEDYFDGVEAAVRTFEEFRRRSSIASKPRKGMAIRFGPWKKN